MYQGDANELIAKLAQLDVARINMSEPDLEEIFMHYYEKE
jgi:ABC-2 type transport system ATP-binding protein